MHLKMFVILAAIFAATSAPAVACRSSNRVDVFVRGTDNTLWVRPYFGGSWKPWQSLGGALTSGLGANASGPGHLMVFVRGTDNGIWFKSYG